MLSPFRTIVVFIAFTLLGIAVVPQLSVDLNSTQQGNTIHISYSLPNSPPSVVEQVVTAPLENVISQITGIKKMKSSSRQGSGDITIEFGREADMAFKRFEVSTKLRQIHSKLPQEMSYPVINQTSQGQKYAKTPVLIYSISAPFIPHEISRVAKEVLSIPIKQLTGVENVKIAGAEELQVSIVFEPERLQLYNLTVDNIVSVLQERNKRIQLGLSQKEGMQYFLFVPKEVESISQIKQLPIQTRNQEGSLLQNPIVIQDVAEVFVAEQRIHSYYRVNGKNAIRLLIEAEGGINKLQLSESVATAMTNLKGQLPKGYTINLDYDDTAYINEELTKVYERTSFSIIILLLFILIVHRKFNYLIVLFSGLIVNLALTLLISWLLNINIHLYSLAGLTVSFGLIMDNAIVMLDHLHKKGNQQVFKALFAASLTTIVALMLILLLPHEERMNLTEFGQIVALNLGVSLLVAWFYTPAIYQLVFSIQSRSHVKEKNVKFANASTIANRIYYAIIHFLVRFRKTFYVTIIFLFGLPVFLLPPTVDGWHWYNKTIGSEAYQKDIRVYVNKALGGALRMFVVNVFESSGYRSPEKTKLHVNAEMQAGTTLDQMNFVMERVEEFLSQIEGVDQYVTRISSPQHGSIVISFSPEFEKGMLPFQLKSRLQNKAIDWGGVEWSIFGVGKGFSSSGGDPLPSFKVEMRGFNYDELEKQTAVLANKLLKHKRIQKVNTNERLSYRDRSTYEYILSLDLSMLETAQMSPSDVMRFVQIKSPVFTPQAYFSLKDVNLPVFVSSQTSEQFSIYELMESTHLIAQKAIQLKEMGSLSFEESPSVINKEDRQYIRIVSYDYLGGFSFGKKFLKETLTEMESEIPIGYTIKQQEDAWTVERVKRQYGLLGILIVGIYFICAILFESFKQPLLIISTIPISFIGLFLTFAFSDFYFDQGGYAAFVLLGGLVVNASIFIVNDLNNADEKLYNAKLMNAVSGKAIPVFLTIISTICGLTPFLMDGQGEVFWFSLAVGSIGGLVFSLFAVFIFRPVALFDKKRKSPFQKNH